jgi:hypothetical protein
MKARPWVKLSTGLINDDEWLDLSAEAKVVYLAGLAKSGADGTDGVVPCSPRSVARWTGLDEQGAADAVAELVCAGFWEIDGAHATIRNWNAHQPSIEELEAKREATKERVTRHREKKRAEKTGAVPTTDGELDAATVRSNLWKALDSSLSDEMSQETAIAIYRVRYDEAIAAGSEGGKYSGVKGIGAATLANLVVNHAALRWLGIEPDSPQLRRLHALRKDHGAAVLDLLPLAAAGAKGDAVAYLSTMLRKGAA